MREWILAGEGPHRTLLKRQGAIREPALDEVAVRMHAASLNYRDLMILDGVYSAVLPKDLVPLSDGAGEVVAVGQGVTNVEPGQRVVTAFFPDWRDGDISAQAIRRTTGGTINGVLNDLAILPASAVLPFPDHMDFADAATLPCAGLTAWNALVNVCTVTRGATVLLQGTGGVSTFALQLTKLLGGTVIQLSSSDEKLEQARQRGADHLINYRSTVDWDKSVLAMTNGAGVDAVVEVGGAGTLERAIRSVRVGGTIVAVGLVSGLGRIDPLPLIGGAIRLQGVMVGSQQMFGEFVQFCAVNELRPVISKRVAFEDAPRAYQLLKEGVSGKIVIDFD